MTVVEEIKDSINSLTYSIEEFDNVAEDLSAMKVSVHGKKIREAVKGIKNKIYARKELIRKQIIECAKSISEKPQKSYTGEKAAFNLQSYDYTQMYSKTGEVVNEKMIKHNKLLNELIRLQLILKKTEPLKDLIKDNKKYNISLGLAAKIGINESN